jgi:hypothetical protein
MPRLAGCRPSGASAQMGVGQHRYFTGISNPISRLICGRGAGRDTLAGNRFSCPRRQAMANIRRKISIINRMEAPRCFAAGRHRGPLQLRQVRCVHAKGKSGGMPQVDGKGFKRWAHRVDPMCRDLSRAVPECGQATAALLIQRRLVGASYEQRFWLNTCT